VTKRLNCKFGLSRRIGQSLWGTAKDPVHKRNYPSGQHGPSGRKKRVGYGEQLESTQMLRGYYGNITKKQFTRIVKEALRRRGDNTENLIGLLESRLDALVYRSKFASTPFAARQLINHKHITVNGRVVNIASYVARPGDVIEVRARSKEMAVILEAIASGERHTPDYISVETGKLRAQYVRVPAFSEVPYAVAMKPSLVVEFFSR